MSHEEEARLRRSERALSSARILLKQGLLEDAYSRAYYSLLHLLSALLLKMGEELPKTHAGLLAKVWAKRDKLKLSDEEVKRISRYQSLRENGDYSPIPAISEPDVEEVIEFVESLRRRHYAD